MKLLVHNGRLISESTFSGLNRGLYYGDGFFETMRLINGRVHLFNVHMKRFSKAMMHLGLNSHDTMSHLNLNVSREKVAAANEIDNGRVRLTVYRTAGGAFVPESDEVEWVAELISVEQNGFEINRKGLLIDVYKKERKWQHSALPFKSLNAAFYIQAGRFARDKKVDEVLVLNENDEIIESLYSNIFYFLNNKLCTPPIEGGGLPGVMRAFVIHVLQKNGVEVLERILQEEDLYNVEELFLTNAVKGIQWVGGFGAKRFYSRHIREYSNYLQKTISLKAAV